VFATPKLAKCPELVTMRIGVIKYIKVLSKSDKMFQKSFLGDIEVDSMLKVYEVGLKKT
jgi:hypothetical protein